MKILYLTTGCFDKGGISRYNRYQITACRELFGSENVRVLSLLGPSENDFEEPFKVYWHGHGIDWRSKMGLIRQCVAQSMVWRPDMILCAHVNFSGLACAAARFCGARVVLNAYGLEIWSPMRNDAKWGLRKADYIIADCHNTADYLTGRSVRDAQTISVIWDCIDLTKFRPVEVGPEVLRKYGMPDSTRQFTVLSLGRLSLPDALYKGYDRLIRVAALLKEKGEFLAVVIAGRGGYIPHLKEMAERLGVAENIFFTGSIEEEDMAAVYNNCSVFSLITESGEGKGEGIPLTPLEAMACGKPVLVGNQDGSREAIVDGNGCSFDPENLSGQADALQKYMHDPVWLKCQSESALAVSRKYFSYSGFVAKHRDFFLKFKAENDLLED